MFAFTFMGGTIDTSVNEGRGPNVYRLQGQNCHKIDSLLPPPGKPPKFNQLYIQDTENENQNQIEAFRFKMLKFCLKEEQSTNEKQRMNVINLIDLIVLQDSIIVLCYKNKTRSILI